MLLLKTMLLQVLSKSTLIMMLLYIDRVDWGVVEDHVDWDNVKDHVDWGVVEDHVDDGVGRAEGDLCLDVDEVAS
jgi:hypothetical protein